MSKREKQVKLKRGFNGTASSTQGEMKLKKKVSCVLMFWGMGGMWGCSERCWSQQVHPVFWQRWWTLISCRKPWTECQHFFPPNVCTSWCQLTAGFLVLQHIYKKKSIWVVTQICNIKSSAHSCLACISMGKCLWAVMSFQIHFHSACLSPSTNGKKTSFLQW